MGMEQVANLNAQSNDRWSEAEILRDSRILEHTHSFIVEYNLKDGQCYIDPAQRKYVYGDWNAEGLNIKKDYRHIVLREDIPVLQNFFDFDTLQAGDSRSVDVRFYVEAHAYEWFRVTLVCYGNTQGEKERVLITFTNAEKELETVQKLQFLLARDSLTHIPNLDTFTRMTSDLIQKYPERSFAVIRMDIDKFRIVNQMYGTTEGDNILRFLGVRLQEWMESLSEDVTYCRIASDMFGVCMPSDAEQIEKLISFLQQALKSYPIHFDMVMSFGIYITSEEDRQERVSVSILMDRAAAAQRTIKNSYVNHVAYYDSGIRKKEIAEQVIVSEMKSALETNQFQVYLQPKCEMDTGKIIGSEALVRWIHPKQGIISPGEFVPVFEKNGFISELDYFVLETTCAMIRRWLDEGRKVYPISVNVSRTDLYNPNLLKQIQECVGRYDVPHDLIAFELTESAFVSDNMQLYNLAKLLQENNFHVLMDDFGSGYSSLNSLREIPVDVLKIDLKFLPPSPDDERGNVILRSVVEMANRLGLETVVEGVETVEQAKFLLSIGCRNAQGFYFYRPMPVSDYEQCLEKEPAMSGVGMQKSETGKKA